ncbi:MAG: SpoVR family protein [Candidatus Delongbacteria bacterium]|nr:SpoVR family protein [Candidatus Delongbacteria bacterium]MBN2834823.1 SpoVR family protein [Candidatus Delongbacteria bacterium]
MHLIDQRTKQIMEDCKTKARSAGLSFDKETLEYIVTNRDMIDLSPKVMIPTLYDYWVNDVDVLKNRGQYKLYPHNPYETVINSRPAISYYNDNNPDWMNIMIFYHVIGHIDFFQNNHLFEKTWNDDFVGQALSDKRLIESLRVAHGRYCDYVIEFGRSIDNITGYFNQFKHEDYIKKSEPEEIISFYFDNFLPNIAGKKQNDIFKEIYEYNLLIDKGRDIARTIFINTVKNKHPEFESYFERHKGLLNSGIEMDVLEFITEYSPFLKKEKNQWMRSVLSIIRNTSLYFAPQIRSKIINEGWASYWHDTLFIQDERIKGHEADYAKLNAGVTSLSRVGLNPYAIGLRLIQHIEDLADKGKISWDFQKIKDSDQREKYDKKIMKGKEAIFELRKNFSDFVLINTFVDQDFVDKYDLFVVGKRLDTSRNVYQYYIKSRKAEDYKQMLIDSLYHPPHIVVDTELTDDNTLYLVHKFEGKQLIKDFIPDVIHGLGYLWGGDVKIETTEIVVSNTSSGQSRMNQRVRYVFHDGKVNKEKI